MHNESRHLFTMLTFTSNLTIMVIFLPDFMTNEMTSVLQFKIFHTLIVINHSHLWSLYFTTYSLHTILQFVFWVHVLSLKNRFILSFKRYQEDITPYWRVFYHLCADDEKWYWQLNFGSELTIVSLLCLLKVLVY